MDYAQTTSNQNKLLFLKIIFLVLFLGTSLKSFSSERSLPVSIDKAVSYNADIPFVKHTGSGAFDNVLAMNVRYEPIRSLRNDIEKFIGYKLDFLRSWNPNGEAHVTTVTPVEFHNVLGRFVSIEKINRVATDYYIQSSDLEILGIGSGSIFINSKREETYFVIVESTNLRRIRLEIWKEFIRKGGNPSDWDPSWFFPHVTVGFTKRDLHESDGVIKNIKYSLDTRFILQIK